MALSHPPDRGATCQPAPEEACPTLLPRSPEGAAMGTSVVITFAQAKLGATPKRSLHVFHPLR
eukprot:6489064-Amphidinium_carterae.2